MLLVSPFSAHQLENWVGCFFITLRRARQMGHLEFHFINCIKPCVALLNFINKFKLKVISTFGPETSKCVCVRYRFENVTQTAHSKIMFHHFMQQLIFLFIFRCVR